MTLGAVFALRLLGIFLILPVFSVWAQTLDGGTNAFMVGLALGVYGLTQAVLQIPFGAASDRFGRKPVIVTGLLIFIFGSLLAYTADDITTLLFARALQGAGAVSAAVTAMISDSVRDKLLTRAMAFVGASIGISFTFSLVLAPVLADSIGVPGIFLLTAVLCVLAIVAVLMLPTAPVKRFEDFQARARLRDVFLHGQLMRLNLGIFSLHMAQMALFVVIPLRLVELDLAVAHHWTVYLPAVLVSPSPEDPPVVLAVLNTEVIMVSNLSQRVARGTTASAPASPPARRLLPAAPKIVGRVRIPPSLYHEIPKCGTLGGLIEKLPLILT